MGLNLLNCLTVSHGYCLTVHETGLSHGLTVYVPFQGTILPLRRSGDLTVSTTPLILVSP